MKRLYSAGIVVLLAAGFPVGLEALGRPELGVFAAGLRVPVGTLWLIGPMLIAVAGAVTVGWRRAAADGRGGSRNES